MKQRFVPFYGEIWRADEGGANHTALQAVYGPTIKERTITCLFHFNQCKNRYANSLANAAKDGRMGEGKWRKNASKHWLINLWKPKPH